MAENVKVVLDALLLQSQEPEYSTDATSFGSVMLHPDNWVGIYLKPGPESASPARTEKTSSQKRRMRAGRNGFESGKSRLPDEPQVLSRI